MKPIVLVLAMALASPASAEDSPAPLPDMLLTCTGFLEVDAPIRGASTYSDNYGYSGIMTDVMLVPVEKRIVVDFEVRDGTPLVRLPASVVAQINNNKAGWFKVKDLEVSDREISGKIAVNFLSAPKFRIDRRTGVMTSSGGYRGACEKQDISTQKF